MNSWNALMISVLFLSAALESPLPVRAQGGGGPADTSSGKGRLLPGTALARSREVLFAARKAYPDARWLGVEGRANRSGIAVCDPEHPSQDGWRHSFYSDSAGGRLLVCECRGRIAGPFLEMGSSKDRLLRPIEEDCIDSGEAVRAVSAKFPPRLRGRRPLFLRLSMEAGAGGAPAALQWEISADGQRLRVGAARSASGPAVSGAVQELLSQETEAQRRAQGAAARPSRPGVLYTARTDMDRVMNYAARSLPGSDLMAIEGFTDARGSSPCLGEGDGWMYYFVYPNGRMAVLFACNGKVGPGALSAEHIDIRKHAPVEGRFVDTPVLLAALLRMRPSAMNEGMGRRNTRLASAKLLSFREPPFPSLAAGKKLFWFLDVGNTRYAFDAEDGRLVDTKE